MKLYLISKVPFVNYYLHKALYYLDEYPNFIPIFQLLKAEINECLFNNLYFMNFLVSDIFKRWLSLFY